MGRFIVRPPYRFLDSTPGAEAGAAAGAGAGGGGSAEWTAGGGAEWYWDWGADSWEDAGGLRSECGVDPAPGPWEPFGLRGVSSEAGGWRCVAFAPLGGVPFGGTTLGWLIAGGRLFGDGRFGPLIAGPLACVGGAWPWDNTVAIAVLSHL